MTDHCRCGHHATLHETDNGPCTITTCRCRAFEPRQQSTTFFNKFGG